MVYFQVINEVIRNDGNTHDKKCSIVYVIDTIFIDGSPYLPQGVFTIAIGYIPWVLRVGHISKHSGNESFPEAIVIQATFWEVFIPISFGLLGCIGCCHFAWFYDVFNSDEVLWS